MTKFLQLYQESVDEAVQAKLKDIIAEIEASHFRTEHDSGAASNAMLVHNALRMKAGLPYLTVDQLDGWCVKCAKYHNQPCERKPKKPAVWCDQCKHYHRPSEFA